MSQSRDPRLEPKPGDIVRLRNKVRRVTAIGLCVRGLRRVCYEQVTTKELSCYGERWDKTVKHAEVLHVAD
jgi:hypothetical protein